MRILRALAGLGVAAGLMATSSNGVVQTRPIDLGGSPTSLAAPGPLANFEADGNNLVRLLAGALIRRRTPLLVPGIATTDAATLPAGTAQPWLVQVRDKRYADVGRAVAHAGAQILGTVPDDTYLVRATPAQRSEIAANAAVRWMGYYQPACACPWRPGASLDCSSSPEAGATASTCSRTIRRWGLSARPWRESQACV